MIGIICAMSEERDAILKVMKNVVREQGRKLFYHGTVMDTDYYVGKIADKEVALYHCGIGKVNAALCTVQCIEKHDPELVINVGCAGSLNENVHVNDVVVGTRVADWEIDCPGWERSIYSDKLSYACAGKCLKALESVDVGTTIHQGPIVSSDMFIYKKEQVEEIKKYFPEALCGEMEGVAIANVCYAYGVAVSIIRSISDETLVAGDYQNFDFNLLKVCDTAAQICAKIIEKY